MWNCAGKACSKIAIRILLLITVTIERVRHQRGVSGWRWALRRCAPRCGDSPAHALHPPRTDGGRRSTATRDGRGAWRYAPHHAAPRRVYVIRVFTYYEPSICNTVIRIALLGCKPASDQSATTEADEIPCFADASALGSGRPLSLLFLERSVRSLDRERRGDASGTSCRAADTTGELVDEREETFHATGIAPPPQA